MQHTPGPWKVVMNSDNDWDGTETKHIGFVGPNGEDILNGCGECGSPWCENPADARLLSAAPELLEALKLYKEVHPVGNHMEHLRELNAKVDAAIAKAESSHTAA